MKLNEEFVLRQVADTWVVMPLGQTSVDFSGMLTLLFGFIEKKLDYYRG